MSRIVGVFVALYLVLLVVGQLPASRHITGDAVPGRYGGLLLHCGGGFDLARVDWIAERDAAGKLPYWGYHDNDGHVVSTFGPMPAEVMRLALIGTGDTVSDAALRARERFIACFMIALAACALALAALRRRSLRDSIAIGAIAALSYAGLATLGQALWQQTVALPPLVGALAAVAWRDERPAALHATLPLLAIAVLVRPAIAPLACGIGLTWLLARPARWWLGVAIACIVAVPFVWWNLAHTGSVLPLGQATANAALTDETFAFSRAQIGLGIGGLLISPARGVLWYAPIVIVGVVRAIRQRKELPIAGAMIAQLVMMALFYRWWGGHNFGPRLLDETVWIGIWLALGSQIPIEKPKRLLVVATAVTVIVGQLGLWMWRAEQWETRRQPDIDDSALWDFVDSPIPSTFRSVDRELTAIDVDAPRAMQCDGTGVKGVAVSQPQP